MTARKPLNAFEALADTPLQGIMDVLNQAGRDNFTEGAPWETALCALVLRLEPKCKTHRLIDSLPYHTRAYDELDVLNTMAHLGYFARKADIRLENVDPRLLPCMFVVDGTPMIIMAREGDRYNAITPKGAVYLNAETESKMRGTAWFFQPYDERKASTSKFLRSASGFNWFRALLRRFKGIFTQVMTAGLILNIIALATPLFIMLVYDRVIAAGSIDVLPMLAVGAGIALVLEWMLRRIRSRGLSWLAARMDNIVGNRIFAHLVGLSPALIEQASVASQIARIKTFETVRDFFSGSVFLSMLELPFGVLAAIAIYAIAGPLVFVPLAIAGVYALLFWFIRRQVKVAIRLAAKASSARQSFTIETFEKLYGIRSYGLARRWQEKFRDLSGKEMLAHFRLSWLGMMGETIAHALTVLSAVATIGFGVHLVWAGTMSTGALVASMILVWRVLTPFYSLCTMIPRLEQLRNSIIQVNTLMDLDTEAVESRGYARLPRLKGRVQFVNVFMRYTEDTDPVFQGLSFDARPGDLVVVTGENGAGKTTLLKLVKALYRVNSGSVRIDGFDIRQMDATDLRRQIAYVPQKPDFFTGSILDNLRVGNPLASIEEAEEALSMANALAEVRALPEGFNTIIGRHVPLSISLQTRLSLARAYLHPASVLLIDELPNTLLGGKTGSLLKEYLARMKGKRTCILVSYREDYLKLADTIVALRYGHDAMVGNYQNIKTHMVEEEKA